MNTTNSPRRSSNVLTKAAFAFALAVTLAHAARAQAPASSSIEDTTWSVTDSTGSTFVFEFDRGGLFRATSWAGAVSKGRWSLEADKLLVRLDAKAGEYRGVVKGDSIEGEAEGAGFGGLNWEARREEARPVRSASAAPPYPTIAVAARAGGVVVIEVKVDAAGRVSSAEARSGHPLLQQAARDAAKRWEFNPEAGAGTRVARLFFVFSERDSPKDCSKRLPAPAPEFLSDYQMKIRHAAMCVEFSVDHQGRRAR